MVIIANARIILTIRVSHMEPVLNKKHVPVIRALVTAGIKVRNVMSVNRPS